MAEWRKEWRTVGWVVRWSIAHDVGFAPAPIGAPSQRTYSTHHDAEAAAMEAMRAMEHATDLTSESWRCVLSNEHGTAWSADGPTCEAWLSIEAYEVPVWSVDHERGGER